MYCGSDVQMGSCRRKVDRTLSETQAKPQTETAAVRVELVKHGFVVYALHEECMYMYMIVCTCIKTKWTGDMYVTNGQALLDDG